MNGYVDAQIHNSELLLELVQTYPGITTTVLVVGGGLFVALLVWAVIAAFKEKKSQKS